VTEQTTRESTPRYRGRALAQTRPSTIDADNRTIEAILTKGDGRQIGAGRMPVIERLQVSEDAVDTTRLNAGGGVFLDHRASTDHQVGRIVPGSVRIEDGALVGRIEFGTDAQGDRAFRLARQGILDSLSVGYVINRAQESQDDDGNLVLDVVDWTPAEVSLVGVPAEVATGFRSADPPPVGGDALEAADQAMRYDLPDLARRALAGDASPTRTRETIIQTLEERQMETPTQPHVATPLRGDDPLDAFREAATEALVSRMNGAEPQTQAGRDARGMSLMDIATECLRQRGEKITAIGKSEIATRAFHTTSDFPTLLKDSGNRVLADQYRHRRTPLMQVAREVDAPDFREFTRLQFGDSPALLKVNEHGEFTRGTLDSTSEKLKVDTYGRVLSFTRQAIINDDLGAITDFVTGMAGMVAALEADLLGALLTANGGAGVTMSDGTPIFDASHSNEAGASAITTDGLSAARQLLREQTAVQSDTPLNLAPATIVVGTPQETAAQQVVATVTPTQPTQVNPFAGQLGVVTEPRLNAAGSWWLFAQPSQAGVIALVRLNGQTAPALDSRDGFDVDGVEFRVRHDVGAGVLDHRGAVRTPLP